MDTPEITQDAQRLAFLIYKQYKKDIKDGQNKLNAKNIGSLTTVHKTFNIKYSLDDTLDLVRELSKADYLKVTWADNTAVFINIQPKLITFGEYKFANNFDFYLNWANKIVSIIKP